MILGEIRVKTRPAHERLEQKLDLFERVTSRDQYRELLEKFYRFYLPLETQLDGFMKGSNDSILWQTRRKTALLKQDLLDLGSSNEEIESLNPAPLASLPEIKNTEQAWGCLYVLEGSTLGGKIIAKKFSERFELGHGQGLSFYLPYGNKVGEMWKEFCIQVESYAASLETSSRSLVVDSAEMTFLRLESWLSA